MRCGRGRRDPLTLPAEEVVAHLEPILEISQGLPEGDERTGEVKESKVVGANSLPAHEQAPKAVVPSIGSLHDPAARLALDASEQGLLAAAPDVRRDPARSNCCLSVLVVVPLVEAEVLRAAGAARRANHDCVERLADQPLVVDVGAGDLGSQRDSPAVGQDVPFDAAFRAIRGIRTREVPPFGAFTRALSSEDHFHWIPRLPS